MPETQNKLRSPNGSFLGLIKTNYSNFEEEDTSLLEGRPKIKNFLKLTPYVKNPSYFFIVHCLHHYLIDAFHNPTE